MARTAEGWFQSSDGMKLYEKTWEPSSPPKAHLIAIHGFSDHVNAYYNLFPTLASTPFNIAVHAFDQRGWGRSVQNPSQRGLTGPTSRVLADIDDFVMHVYNSIRRSSMTPTSSLNSAGQPQQEPEAEEVPLFLFGHSMGGAESLHYLMTTYRTASSFDRPKISGLILESPYVALHPSSQPSSFTVFAGRLAARLLPNAQMKQKLDGTAMSRDPRVVKDWEADALCHDTGTLQGLEGMLRRASDLADLARTKAGPVAADTPTARNADTLPCPVFWTHGTDDRVCDFHASKALFNRVAVSIRSSPNNAQLQTEDPAAKKKWKQYEKAYHKLHAEPDGVGEEFAQDIGEWILSVLGNGTPTTTTTSTSTSATVPDGRKGESGPDINDRQEEEQGVKSKL